ncbi:17529_t:CDS:2, partial [Dentiscutata erythropus]
MSFLHSPLQSHKKKLKPNYNRSNHSSTPISSATASTSTPILSIIVSTSTSTSILSATAITSSILSEQNQDDTINKWKELLIDEELEEQNDLDDNEIDFLNIDIETHLAENQTAKWNLSK